MAVTGAITTGFRDENGVDLGRQLVEKDYLISVYPNLIPNMKAPGLFAWGTGTSGQFGNNTASFASSPTQVLIGSSVWKQVSGGYNHAAAIAIDGTLWAWGLGTSGQLGNGIAGHRSSPIQTISFGTNWSVVSNSGDHVSCTKSDGTLWTWGLGTSGQLGDVTIVTKSSPVQAIVYAENWSSVANGKWHTAAIKTDGTLWLWGNNGYGRLGDNTITHRSSPIQTVAFGSNWSSAAGGNSHTAAIKMDGTLWLWGRNTEGQLGDNTITSKSSPVQVVGFANTWSKIACGWYHTAAIKTDGTIWTWGNNDSGRLGDNSTVYRSSPVQTVAFGTNWSSVACGYRHTGAIKTDGTLWTWGQNSYGNLGDNTIIHRSSPVQTVTGGTNWSSVACGYHYTIAIKTDGTLWTWGRNLFGALGDNTIIHRSSPVQVIGFATNWSSVACGYKFTAATKTDGTLWLWGSNAYGNLGDNTIIHRSSPVQTIVFGSNWSKVACGDFTAAIKKDGTLWTWGYNFHGQLGNNTAGANRSSPVQPLAYAFSTNWSNTSAGGTHTSAIKKDGTLWSWGSGTSGQLGNNTATSTSAPVQEMTFSTTWSSLSAGNTFTGAIKTDSTLWLWGLGTSGQLGDNSATSKSSPVQTVTFGSTWSSISCGTSHVASVKTDGTLWVWGLGTSGQLGDNTATSKSSPIQTITFGSTWSKVSAGYTHTGAIKTDGTAWTWGLGTSGQLGDATIVSKSSPVQVTVYAENWSSVAVGGQHTAVIKTDGTLWCWGRNFEGQLGDNTITHKSSPVQTVTFGTNWSKVACGGFHTAVIKTDGTLWTWGQNTSGQLGDNTLTNKSSPVQVFGFANTWSSVAGGANNTAAIKTDGTLWTWGYNAYGALGDNTTVPRSYPVQPVTGGTNWSKVACGNYHTAAIKTDGTLWNWGSNAYGQLGDNTKIHRSSPIQVVGFATNWSSVSCGYFFTAAIKTDGTLWTWGRNSEGVLGDNTTIHRSSPIQTIAFGTDWNKVACEHRHTGAIKTDGTLWNWGQNTSGQLGDNTTIHKSSPVQVFGFGTNWSSVAVGQSYTAAIKTDGTIWTWGLNSYGRLGDNTSTSRSFPVQPLAYVFATNWSNISCGAINTVATKTNGTLWMWGAGTNGSLGNNLTTTTSLPIQTLAYGTNWSQTNFSAPSRVSGSSTTTAIKTDSTLWVWGNNASGQLANTLFPISRSSPNQTLDYSNQWQQVTGGSTHTMAIKQDGTLWGFGLNSEGEIGANNTSFMVSPIQEFTNSSWKQVAAGYRFSAAIKANNTLWIWGRNSYGNLGDNTTVSKSSPVQEITGGSWAQIACGSYHMGGIKTDGTLWMWGLNTSGQLGDSTTTHRSSPVQTIAGGTNWKQVACGSGAATNSGHTVAIKTDGTLWNWGNGGNGRLGDNTTTNKSSPIQTIAAGTNWRQVICTAVSTLATKTDGSLWSWGYELLNGDNTQISRSSPVQTAIIDKSWKNITIGNMGFATYAIRDWSY